MFVSRLFDVCPKVALSLIAGLFNACSNDAAPDAVVPDAVVEESAAVVVNDGPERNSGLTMMSNHYPLDVAVGNVWGAIDEHFRIDFTLSNGNFSITPVTINGTVVDLLTPAQSTAVFYAQMFSPGTGFSFDTYAFVQDQPISPAQSGVGFFTGAYIGIDNNDDGMVSLNEQISIIDGTVEFTGSLPDIELHFQVTLATGENVQGKYTGLFDFPVL